MGNTVEEKRKAHHTSKAKSSKLHGKKLFEKRFAQSYIEHGMKARPALIALFPERYKTKSKITKAGWHASRLMQHKFVKESIEELLHEAGLTAIHTMEIHRRNMDQDKDVGTSQRAVQDVYKLARVVGFGGDEGHPPININIFDAEQLKRIAARVIESPIGERLDDIE